MDTQDFSNLVWLCVIALVAMCLCAACGSALVPSAPTEIRPLPIAVAGQSNALFITPQLTAAYAPGIVVGFAQDGSRILEWAEGSKYWNTLAPQLHQPLRAFVWWQGESDRDDANIYSDRLREFLSRVRREADDPNLLIVMCRVIDTPAFVDIRAAQESYVRSDPRSVLVSSDALPLEAPDSAHLSAEGYKMMAQLILTVLP